ncbi:MAG TPA: hypothetical protein VFP95_00475, partial [Gammaproteobacteria bacterium]|nr:hypothetical protein [Gammaproteobacteria bacterium]
VDFLESSASGGLRGREETTGFTGSTGFLLKQFCHSREGGNPCFFNQKMDSRLRGSDGCILYQKKKVSFLYRVNPEKSC